jgi:isopenicillin-N epimerase
MVAFHLPATTSAEKLRRGLWERFRIETAVADGPDRPSLRISANFYTTESEIEYVADALKELASG